MKHYYYYQLSTGLIVRCYEKPVEFNMQNRCKFDGSIQLPSGMYKSAKNISFNSADVIVSWVE